MQFHNYSITAMYILGKPSRISFKSPQVLYFQHIPSSFMYSAMQQKRSSPSSSLNLRQLIRIPRIMILNYMNNPAPAEAQLREQTLHYLIVRMGIDAQVAALLIGPPDAERARSFHAAVRRDPVHNAIGDGSSQAPSSMPA